MINILNQRVFKYNNDKSSVTVYGDFTDPDKYYIVPTPRFVMTEIDGKPAVSFVMVASKTQEGVRGTCAMVLELAVTKEEQDVAERHLPGATWGWFDWVTAQAYLEYNVPGQGTVVLNAVPSTAAGVPTGAPYAGAQVAYMIDLPDQATVELFKNAFHKSGGGLTEFRITYNAMALSTMPAVSAKVTYDAAIALEYEKTVNVEENVWGKVTARRETVREYMQKSDSGDTEILWTTPPSIEIQQKVNDWAWVTLEGLVNNAIDDVIRSLGENNSDEFNMGMTASFERTYTENQVIEWSISPFKLLPAFDDAQWPLHFSEYDVRHLAVTFSILDSLKDNDIQSVMLTVKYKGAETHNTYKFLPDGQTSWYFEADGDYSSGKYDGTYEYTYEVTYGDGAKYRSGAIVTTDTEVILPLSALGIQKATFRGSNIDFKSKDGVDFVLIDFYYNTPGGLPNKVEQRKMNANTQNIVIESRTHLPDANEYTYQLTYVMKEKNRYYVAPMQVFPPQNRDAVTIISPFMNRTINLSVDNTDQSANPYRVVQLEATYMDELNGNQGEHQYMLKPKPDEFLFAKPWEVTYVLNPNGSYIKYNGLLVCVNGEQRAVQNLITQKAYIVFNPSLEMFTVTVSPLLVAWNEGVQAVFVTLYMRPEGGSDTQKNDLVFHPTQQEQKVLNQYYLFQRAIDTPVSYYYQAVYAYEDGTTKYVKETPKNNLTVLLPKNGNSDKPVWNEIPIPISLRGHDRQLVETN